MNSAFGADFSKVRIHTGDEAVQMNKELKAQAFTHGNHIYFNQGKYNPNSLQGKHLLAHELTHTIQQGGNTQTRTQPNLQLADECGPGHHRIWGGFDIRGDCNFVRAVRADLNSINATSLGNRLLSWVTANRSGLFTPRLPIIPLSAAGYLPTKIYYTTPYVLRDRCASGSWRNVPSYVYLFHEVVHFWLDEHKGYGSHPQRECMATGLGSYFTSLNYNENKFRCELGLPIRPCYGTECLELSSPNCESIAPAPREPSIQEKVQLKKIGAKNALESSPQNKYLASQADKKPSLASKLHVLPQASTTNSIQKSNDSESNLEKLKGLLDNWFNVREDEVIALLKKLNASEIKKVTSDPWFKDKMAKAFTTSQMSEAVTILNLPLDQKLLWVEASANFKILFDYTRIRPLVANAPEKEREALKTVWWRDFFVDVCSDVTMYNALVNLDFDIYTTIDWLLAEGGNFRCKFSIPL